MWVVLMKSKYGAICKFSQKEAVNTSSSSPLYGDIEHNSTTSALTLQTGLPQLDRLVRDLINYFPLLTRKARQTG